MFFAAHYESRRKWGLLWAAWNAFGLVVLAGLLGTEPIGADSFPADREEEAPVARFKTSVPWWLLGQGWWLSERGGDRSEARAQDRLWTPVTAGAAGIWSFRTLTVGTGAEATASQDTHYLNRGERSSTQSAGIGVVALGVGYGQGQAAGTARPIGDGPGIGMPPTLFLGVSGSVGRLHWQSDPEGFFFSGYASGGFLSRSAMTENSFWNLALFGHGPMRTPEEAGKDRASTPDDAGLTVWGGLLDVNSGPTRISFFGAFVHVPERPAIAGFNVGSVPIVEGQLGRDSVRTAYGGGRIAADLSRLHFVGSFWAAAGSTFAVHPTGWRNASTEKDIHGSLAYGSIDYDLGMQGSPTRVGCLESTAPRLCIAHRPEAYQASAGAAVLFTTRDDSPSDAHYRGFSAPAPLPQVAGGAASILVTGPSPLQIHGPFDRVRETPAREFPAPGEWSRTGPPAAGLDFGNQGLQLASLRCGFWYELVHLDIWTNFADLGRARGREAIGAARFPLGSILQNGYDVDIVASVSAAWVRPDHREYDEWTGLSKRPRTRFYARYLFGAVIRL